MAKIHSKEAAIGAGGTISITCAEVVVIGKDDGFMRCVIHPPGHGALGVVIGARTGVDDLAAPSAGIARRDLPLPIGRTIRAGVREEIIGRLVIAVDPGRVLERIGICQCAQASQGALGVDEAEHLVLKGAIMNQAAAGFRGGARCYSRRGIRTGWRGCCGNSFGGRRGGRSGQAGGGSARFRCRN